MCLVPSDNIVFCDLVDFNGGRLGGGGHPLTVEQLVEVAIEVNPQVRVAKEQWNVAQHQDLAELCTGGPDVHLLESGQQQRLQCGGAHPFIQRKFPVSGKGAATGG